MQRYNFWMTPAPFGGAIVLVVPIARTVATRRLMWLHRKHPKAFLPSHIAAPARFMIDPRMRFWRDVSDQEAVNG